MTDYGCFYLAVGIAFGGWAIGCGISQLGDKIMSALTRMSITLKDWKQ